MKKLSFVFFSLVFLLFVACEPASQTEMSGTWKIKSLMANGEEYIYHDHVRDYAPDIAKDQNYDRNRFSVGVDYRSKSFNIHSEYLLGKDDKVSSSGVYVTGSVALIPSTLDLIGSYDYFNFNQDLDMDQHKGVFGIQWWYYKKCRLQLQYVYKNAVVTPGGFVHDDNHAIMCQVQVRFN